MPRKVQDVIPIRRIWKDGIFQVGGRFSKTYQFTDINYLVASREDKEQILSLYHFARLIHVEEDFLFATFGNEYLQYKKKVCRYIGRKR